MLIGIESVRRSAHLSSRGGNGGTLVGESTSHAVRSKTRSESGREEGSSRVLLSARESSFSVLDKGCVKVKEGEGEGEGKANGEGDIYVYINICFFERRRASHPGACGQVRQRFTERLPKLSRPCLWRRELAKCSALG